MLQAGPWQLRNMNGSPAKVIHAARCGGHVMIRFSWGRGPAHVPTLEPDAHDKNLKLAKEVQWLASLMTTVCNTEHHCAYTVMASCSLLWSTRHWEVIDVSFRGAQASMRGEAIHTADEVQQGSSITADRCRLNNTGSCFIHWQIRIQRPVLTEQYNAILV